MTNALSIMNRFKGEELLAGSHILTQITALKNGLRYETSQEVTSFDDYFLFLQEKIDAIPRIKLVDSITRIDGGRYENELLSTLEDILDEVERWTIKVVRFQGDLTRAKSDVEELSTTFESWYFVAASELIQETGLKLAATHLKSLATSEFNRLMDRSNLSLDALIEAVKIELKRLDSKRKMARQKFEMGREQVAATWANLPESQGYSTDAPRFNLLSAPVLEEEPDVVPAFVSRSGRVIEPILPAASGPILPEPTHEAFPETIEDPGFEDVEQAEANMVGVIVEQTEPVAAPQIDLAPLPFHMVPFPASTGVLDRSATEIKGTFQKTGDAEPVRLLDGVFPADEGAIRLVDEETGHVEVVAEFADLPARQQIEVIDEHLSSTSPDAVREFRQSVLTKLGEAADAEPSKRRSFDFGEINRVDLTSPSADLAPMATETVPAPAPATVSPASASDPATPASPTPTPEPETSPKPRSRAALVFDFDDDEL